MPTAARTREDIDRVKEQDEFWKHPPGVLWARMKAVLAAQQAVRQREVGARAAYRASLIDLAAISEAMAGDLQQR
jgi:hypothetical protein